MAFGTNDLSLVGEKHDGRFDEHYLLLFFMCEVGVGGWGVGGGVVCVSVVLKLIRFCLDVMLFLHSV